MPDRRVAKLAVDMRLQNSAMSARAIAEALGVAQHRVDAALEQWGITHDGPRARALRRAPGKPSAHRATNTDFSAALRGLDITLSDAARLLGRSMSTICGYASGDKVPESTWRLLNLIVALGVERAEQLISEGETIHAGWRAAEFAAGKYPRPGTEKTSPTPVDTTNPMR